MERRRLQRPLNWSTYNLKVLKQVHGANNLGMSAKAMTVLNDMLWSIYHRMMKESETLMMLMKKSTIYSRTIQTAVRLIFPGELAKHAMGEGNKSVVKCGCACVKVHDNNNNNHIHQTAPPKKSQKSNKIKVPRSSKSARVGLTFPVGRIQRKMREDTKYRVSDRAGTYFSAVLEYLAAEILELAGNAARDNRKKRIIPRHIMLAVKNDEELDRLFGNYTIAFGGNMPAITVIIMKPKISLNNVNAANTPVVLQPQIDQ